jgi:hypothetical protein
MNPFTKPTATRRPLHRRFVAAGVIAAGLSVVGAGVATAVAPSSPVGLAVTHAAHTVGIDWSAMPAGYTKEQYQAFWGAGYSPEDVAKLGDLWKTDTTQTKARAGQMLLDGKELPIAPSPVVAQPSSDDDLSTFKKADQSAYDAFWDAGYTDVNLTKLNDLWKSGSFDTKARAGRMILDGQTPPVAPSGTPAKH